MKKTVSLKKNSSFQKVYKSGASYANKHFVMIILKNNLTINRLGITVSKKVGKSVVRSRVTRLIKEAYRLNEEKMSVGFDIVVIARVACNGLSFLYVERSLMHLLKKHSII